MGISLEGLTALDEVRDEDLDFLVRDESNLLAIAQVTI